MTLTAGDMAAMAGTMGSMITAMGIAVRYFVKSEIKIAIDGLKLEMANERRAEMVVAAAKVINGG